MSIPPTTPAGSTGGPAPAGPTDGPSPADEVRSWRGSFPTSRLVLIGIASVALGVLALTGGLDPAPKPVPVAAAATPVNHKVVVGPWAATVINGVATTDLGESIKPRTEGNWLLAVVVRLEVTGPNSEPALRFQEAVALPELNGLVDKEPRYVLLLRDASKLASINPGIPERVAYIFEVASSTAVPGRVKVVLNGYTARFGFSKRTWTWEDFGPRAEVSLDVEDKTEAT